VRQNVKGTPPVFPVEGYGMAWLGLLFCRPDLARLAEFEFGFEACNFAVPVEGCGVFFEDGKEEVDVFTVPGNGDAFVLAHQVEVFDQAVADDFAVFFLDAVEFEPVSFGVEAEVLEIFAVDFEFFVGIEFIFGEDFLGKISEIRNGL